MGYSVPTAVAASLVHPERLVLAMVGARAFGRAAVLELVTDPEQISTRTTITRLRAAATA